MKSRPKDRNDLISKFEKMIYKEADGCHIFSGTKDKNGYGKISFKYKKIFAHRLSYEIHFGPIPTNKVICHRCDNPPCVNHEHLFLGTSLENNMDKIAKGRDVNKTKTHCKRGHEFTPDNTSVCKNGKRKCKTCDRLNHRRLSKHKKIESMWLENRKK